MLSNNSFKIASIIPYEVAVLSIVLKLCDNKKMFQTFHLHEKKEKLSHTTGRVYYVLKIEKINSQQSERMQSAEGHFRDTTQGVVAQDSEM